MNLINKFHNWRRKLRWNKQYRKGRWKNLRNDIEKLRYDKIIHFIKTYSNTKPTILDLGSGEGILCERLDPLSYNHFLGIDFSSVSIEQALVKNMDKSEFKVADLHTYNPNEKFDIIIFNEAFYYIHNSEKENVLNTMINNLNPNGIIITSIYREGAGCWGFFDKPPLEQLDFTIVKTSDKNTYWKIGVYKKY